MNRGLQELVNLFLYFDSENGAYMCEINFKDNLEPYAIVSVESFIGDLLACTIENVDGVRDDELAAFCDPWFGKTVVAPSAPFAELNEVARRVIESIADTPAESAKFLHEINSFLCNLFDSGQPLSENAFNSLLLSSGLYAPPCTLFVPKQNDYGRLYEAFSIGARPRLTAVNIMKLDSFSSCVFYCECDSFSEVVISLLRYVSLVGCTLSRCEHCNRWFIPLKKRDEKYCSRVYEGKSCKEIATAEKRKNRLQNSPIQKKYNSVNTNLANKAKKATGKTRDRLYAELFAFRDNWQEKKKVLDEAALMDWLNTF